MLLQQGRDPLQPGCVISLPAIKDGYKAQSPAGWLHISRMQQHP
jgi:hypothetical protein